MAMEDALVDRGLDVIVATTLRQADELIALAMPDAALLDLQLPDGLSLDLAHVLHQQGCAVAFSSAFDDDTVPSGFEFAARFRKPASPDLLADWVVASLKGS